MTKKVLLDILEDLGDDEFENFKWHLKDEKVGDILPIKEIKLSKAKMRDVVDLMVQKYTFPGAVRMFKSILKKISRNDLVGKLPNISSGAEDQERVLQRKFHTFSLPPGELHLTRSQTNSPQNPKPTDQPSICHSQTLRKESTNGLEKIFKTNIFLLNYLRDNHKAFKDLEKQLSAIGCRVELNFDEEEAVVRGDIEKGPGGASGGAAERWEPQVDEVFISLTESYLCYHVVQPKRVKILLQDISFVTDDVKVYTKGDHAVVVGDVQSVKERIAILGKRLLTRKELPVVEKQFKLVEEEFSREICAHFPEVKILRSNVNLIILEGPDKQVQLGVTKLEELIKKVKEKRVKLSTGLMTFMTSSGFISRYQARFQQSLRNPVALEVGSDLVLSSLSSAALDEAEAAVLRELSEVTVQLQGATAVSPDLDRVKEILIKAKNEANLRELRVDVSFIPVPRQAAVTKVQLVGYSENVNKLKEVLQDYQMNQIEHLQNEVQIHISDKIRQAGGAGEKLLYHRTTQDSCDSSMTTGFNSRFAGQNEAWLQPKIQNQPTAFAWRTLFGVNRTQDSGPDLRIVMVGRTGVGKSAVGNTILGEKRFRSRPGCESVTETCEKGVKQWGNRVVTVVDTPGILHSAKSAEFITKEILKCVKVSCPGPHVFLLVIQVGRFTTEEKNSVEVLQQLFGPKANQFMIVLFTYGDKLQGTTIQEFVREGNPDLRRVVQSCGNRLHVFDNTNKSDRNQVVELIKKIDDMIAGNGGAYYTDAMYQEVQATAKKLNVKEEDLDDDMFKFLGVLLRRVMKFLKILSKP